MKTQGQELLLVPEEANETLRLLIEGHNRGDWLVRGYLEYPQVIIRGQRSGAEYIIVPGGTPMYEDGPFCVHPLVCSTSLEKTLILAMHIRYGEYDFLKRAVYKGFCLGWRQQLLRPKKIISKIWFFLLLAGLISASVHHTYVAIKPF